MKNLGNISNPKDLVTKEYVDNLALSEEEKNKLKKLSEFKIIGNDKNLLSSSESIITDVVLLEGEQKYSGSDEIEKIGWSTVLMYEIKTFNDKFVTIRLPDYYEFNQEDLPYFAYVDKNMIIQIIKLKEHISTLEITSDMSDTAICIPSKIMDYTIINSGNISFKSSVEKELKNNIEMIIGKTSNIIENDMNFQWTTEENTKADVQIDGNNIKIGSLNLDKSVNIVSEFVLPKYKYFSSYDKHIIAIKTKKDIAVAYNEFLNVKFRATSVENGESQIVETIQNRGSLGKIYFLIDGSSTDVDNYKIEMIINTNISNNEILNIQIFQLNNVRTPITKDNFSDLNIASLSFINRGVNLEDKSIGAMELESVYYNYINKGKKAERIAKKYDGIYDENEKCYKINTNDINWIYDLDKNEYPIYSYFLNMYEFTLDIMVKENVNILDSSNNIKDTLKANQWKRFVFDRNHFDIGRLDNPKDVYFKNLTYSKRSRQNLDGKIAINTNEILTIEDKEELENSIQNIPVYQPKDTGWYDITAETLPPDTVEVQGRMLLRRIDNVVWVYFDNYSWKNGTNNQNKQNFFSQKLTEYTRPPKMSNNRTMRMGTSVVTGDRRDIVITLDWLFPNNIRMIFYYPHFSTHGITSWLTDTPFPENPLGIKEEVTA